MLGLSFFPFSSDSPIIHIYTSVVPLQWLDSLVFKSLHLLFDILWIYYIFNLRDSVLSCVQSINKPHQRASSSLLMFLIASISFWSFLRISITLLTLSIYSCIMSILSIIALHILIAVILNFCLIIPALLPFLVLIEES